MSDVTESNTGYNVCILGLVLVGALCLFFWYYVKREDKGKKPHEKQKEKNTQPEKNEQVFIYLAPGAKKTILPSLTNYIPVLLRGHNILTALINNHSCEIFVDCGTTSAIMKHRAAKQLGLLPMATGNKKVQLRMWAGETRVVMQEVEAVMVEIPGGVSFPCTFLVAPEHCSINSLRGEIFLDNATLRATHAIQRFSTQSSTLFFPNPLPKRTPQLIPDTQYELDNSHVLNKRVRIHVDTGATSFFGSSKYPSTAVYLGVADGVELFCGILKTSTTTSFDFVLGKKLLARYKCVLDLANQYLYFNTKDGVYRARLARTPL